MKKKLIQIALIIIITIICYSNTLEAPFYFDDERAILNNAVVHNPENFLEIFKNYKTRFIGFFSFSLNYAFSQDNPVTYHIINILIHIINSCLIFILASLLLKTQKNIDANRKYLFFIPIFSALIFACHPVQTQAVTYIVQRLASLVALFYLASLVFYIKLRLLSIEEAGNTEKKRYLFIGLSLFFALAAMLTKESSFTIPFSILLIEFVFFSSSKIEFKNSFKFYLPYLLLLPIIPTLYLIGSGNIGAIADVETPQTILTPISSFDYLFTQFNVVRAYIRIIFLPILLNLDYDYPVSRTFFSIRTILSFLFLTFIFIGGVKVFKKDKIISFSILFFFIALSIESSFIPIEDLIFEHRLYLPLAGFAFAISRFYFGYIGELNIFKKNRYLILIIPILVITIFSVMTYSRNSIWSNDIVFWKDVISKSPNKARAYNNLGQSYRKRKMYKEAALEYQRAIKITPKFATAHNNLGTIYEKAGMVDKALYEYKTAIKIRPSLPFPHYNMGNIFSNIKQNDSAIVHYEKAVKFKPDYANAYNNLAIAYDNSGNEEMALENFKKVLTIEPENCFAYYNIGNIYKRQKNYNNAIINYTYASKMFPAKAFYKIGNVYELMEKYNSAILAYEKALKYEPNNLAYKKRFTMLKIKGQQPSN